MFTVTLFWKTLLTVEKKKGCYNYLTTPRGDTVKTSFYAYFLSVEFPTPKSQHALRGLKFHEVNH